MSKPLSPEAYLRAPCVYAVKAQMLGHLKIGYCAKFSGVRRRIAQIQTGVSEPLTLIAAIVGRRECEREFHERFADRRLHGEWFDDRDWVIEDFFLSIRPERDRLILDLADAHAMLKRKQDRLHALGSEVNELRYLAGLVLSQVHDLDEIVNAAKEPA